MLKTHADSTVLITTEIEGKFASKQSNNMFLCLQMYVVRAEQGIGFLHSCVCATDYIKLLTTKFIIM
jgi:hypothetical protein